MNRIHSFDYIRVVAIFIIIMCHYFLFSDLNSGIGRYLGGCGNMIFFLLSALLYGGRYVASINNGVEKVNIKSFVIRRLVKLGASVWPFLIVLILLLLLNDIVFSWVDVALNFAFLGYLGKLPGNGHLWFLTVLLVCYAEYLLFDRLRIRAIWFPYILIIGSIAMMVVFELFGVPGNAFAIIGFFGFVLMKANWFVQSSKRLSLFTCLLIVAFNLWTLYLESKGLFDQSRVLHYLLVDFCGILLLALFLKIMPSKSNKAVAFVSGISFEIYIVHHTLCQGPILKIPALMIGDVAQFLLLLILSVSFAFSLNMVASKLSVLFMKLCEFYIQKKKIL